jgi:hypothetical protein
MTKGKTIEELTIPFVNNGEKFQVPTIKVNDIRAMQLKRAKIDDPEFKEIEGSIVLVHSLLQKVDKTVKIEDIENWEYADFARFIKALWEKNAENFRGIFPNLPKM